MIGDDSTTVAVAGRRATGNVPSLRHPATASSGESGGSSSDTNVPSSTASRCARRPASGAATSSRRRARIAPVGDVLDARRRQRGTPPGRRPSVLDADQAVDRLPRSARPAGQLAGARRELVDGRIRAGRSTGTSGRRPTLAAGRSSVDRRARARPPRPTSTHVRVVDGERLARAEADTGDRCLDAAVLDLQAAHAHVQHAATLRDRRCTRCGSDHRSEPSTAA